MPTVFDFGRNGRAAVASGVARLVGSRIDGKRLEHEEAASGHRHEQHVSSSASIDQADAGNLAVDRDNKYLWRMVPRQIEAEVVRDAVFYVAGKLDLTMGGPDIDYPLGLTVPRRSLYFRTAAEKQMEFLQIFDGPSVTECYERKHSIAPQQALALANSELTIKHARILARTLSAKEQGRCRLRQAAFVGVLSRGPTSEELAECTSFLEQQTQRYRGQGKGNGATMSMAVCHRRIR